jgi:FtsP/CotA-like multicopper oxidase with cupredoxin domain
MSIRNKFSYIPALALLTLMLAVPAFSADVTVNLVAEQVNVTMADGATVPMWGLRNAASPAGTATIPGPAISAVAGDNLIINLTNNLSEPTSLVINGQKATEAGAMVPTWTDNSTGNRTSLPQRVRSFTHEAASGVGTATYRWNGLRAGTFLIESGSHQAVQVPMGLYAALKVDVVAGSQAYPDAGTSYDQDVILLFSEVDPVLNNAVASGEYGSAPGSGLYTTSMGMGYLPRYFLINGTSYIPGGDTPLPAGPANGTTLLRFLNAGSRTRNPVLQGPYMTLIAEDGNPLPYPLQQYSIYLTAGKTTDVVFQPSAEGTLAVYDRSLGLTNNTNSPGGMLANLVIGPAGPGVPATRIGVFRQGVWYLDANGNGGWDPGTDYRLNSFGISTDLPVVGDWTGDGFSKLGVFRNGKWYFDTNGSGQWEPLADAVFPGFGLAGDLPFAGDWNGDGRDEIGVFRNGAWYLDSDGNGQWNPGTDAFYPSFGVAGDLPFVGDWNGDGNPDIGFFRNGEWFLDANNNGIWEPGTDIHYVGFGLPGDIPVIGDWNGDGSSEIGVFRNGRWYLDSNGNGLWEPGTDTLYPAFGLAGDLPLAGNWQ